ncbi:hypothetical protein E6P09_18355 (plasmid) [Haloferax mediterranei ATCC 33500]|uniref:Uncharacterized protein n=1 Tax=Haloferax mediterranei (strain ATCC 33500 / DSM 1411 / JCM 8866 / NBRC 14739 / NCIMB 2177 / R-4) TaxID=523841 RepID=I3R9C9_HALMT|nr:hypothetical protein [Haloferax mediterranei]AFK20839.1 hypothetical protein HFX_5002 [Haloferax mediterranei ATCC 33500]AHZ24285.1 hypothetical protein BM92_18975 [Haloferax mediterranei ATCC 33500]EMA05369.1 hypothetical protein C439_01180 [Haloferax mediterranei ATCC 33500]MDX5989832.1 hypothetical protein [Haloferax mediterranei ATCC 33500]QCQ77275.1 hypothetical protein E6P09_18355 [Haloferax mediterranei ATCC 33500]
MSDDPFGDLDAAMGGEDEVEGETEAEAESEPATADAEEADVTDEPADPRDNPAFEFDETVHKALYVLEAVATDFDDIITYDVERELTRDHGLKNIKKSELHNAALSVVADHPELIVEQVLDQRGVREE